MKIIFKKIIYKILEIESRIVLLIHKPKIIAVTGTVGKTATKDAIFEVLSSQKHVRKNNKSLNSEIGVPLTILGLSSGWNNPFAWIYNIILGFINIFNFKYPKWLVLEVGVDHPNDMENIAKWLRPDVAVIIAFAKIPVHVENFSSPEEVMHEKSKIINYVKDGGIVILNADDENVIKLKSKSKHKVYTFGIENPADINASNYNILYKEDENNNEFKKPYGITFKIDSEGNSMPINIKGVVGQQFMYPALIAFSVGISIGLEKVVMLESLNKIPFARGRMNLIDGKNNSIIIDDTYNASPIAMQKAVETLAEINTDGKKVAVLGDMLEIGHFSASEHRKIGQLIKSKKIDYLITVGLRAEMIAEEALSCKMAKSHVFSFKNSQDAIEKVQEFAKQNNVILVKGSQGIRTEKIVKEIMADKNVASELLIRQEKEWLAR